MDAPQCPICEAVDADVIRNCELRGMVLSCAATAYPLPTTTTPPLPPTPAPPLAPQ